MTQDFTTEQIAALIHEHHNTGKEQLERFCRLYYGDAVQEDLESIAVEDLYGAALSHWQLGQVRPSGTILARVYNPDYIQHGWHSTHTVVEVVTDDMPFLVDSLSMELVRHGLGIHLLLHPIIPVQRDSEGHRQQVLDPAATSETPLNEAYLHAEVDRLTNAEDLSNLQAAVERVLADVQRVVGDWPRMRSRLNEIISHLEAQSLPVADDDKEETLAFLRWLQDHHFTFLGYRAYDLIQTEQTQEEALRVVAGSGLGLYRDTEADHISESFAHLPPALRHRARTPELLILTKSTARSTVHRPAHLDYLGIKRFDDHGQVMGEWRFVGLYTSLAYQIRPREIPILRKKVAHVLKQAGLPPRSHRGKALQHILDTFPRDEMFQATEQELYNIATGILAIQERPRLRLFLRRDIFGRFVTALVFVPRDRYDTELRLQMQEILIEALGGQGSEFNVQFSESVMARVHFIIRTRPDQMLEYDPLAIEHRLAEAMLSWQDKLARALQAQFDEGEGNRLARRYQGAFPPGYQDDHTARTAVVDIQHLQTINDQNPLAMHLYREPEAPADLLRFKVYGRHQPLALSDVLPILERLGLRGLAARPYEVAPNKVEAYWILDFDMTPGDGMAVDILGVQEHFQEAFARIVQGTMESDGFNHLVLAAALPWHNVVLLRALCKYLLQTRLPFSQAYMEQALAGNPEIASLLVKLFHLHFDPHGQSDAERLVASVKARITEILDAVENLDEDRILHHYLALVEATLRTNYFQPAVADKPRPLAFKFDPSRIPDLPQPRPMFEIFVYSPQVEGIHLRGGKVARGGIRWSDRREDYRTEVLGLMKAQMVKNAVIVPVGAKGGFVVKRPPTDAKSTGQEVEACYRLFIDALLDLTDNIVEERIVPPTDVVRHDSDDPYLVVAADKGTATFSDTANALAQGRGFWLGDAFASGGSAGYDHKKMGITARGAWESVKRHFRELGKDIQRQPFSVVGIGSMAGDVFGNGMLLSRQIRLLAAFNHREIFIDPDPDPEVSYQERARLFALPHAAWKDYDTNLISAGGGVYSRAAKSIEVSEQAAQALGLGDRKLIPNELIQALLRAPVDLLWNGAIGTYVKASSEDHVEVSDKANDGVRVNACDLRCRVVGEGGNLGLTQLGRVEFARRGGLINPDFIDNSAGVDCSDHEVNIKILLNRAINAGDITVKQRNEMLAAMTDEVTGLVLGHNYLQSEALSITAGRAPQLLGDHIQLIRTLEREGRLKRRLEFLPSDQELAEREAEATGLTRPELAVLLAYSKIKLFEELQGSNIIDDPFLSRELHSYFPTPLRERFAQAMDCHSLRREIIATQITNSLINRMGSTFCMRMQEETGDSPAEIARAYTAAREIFGVQALWHAIESLDHQIPAPVQYDMITASRHLLDRGTLWLLRHRRPPLDIAATVTQFRDGVASLAAHIPQLIKGNSRRDLRRRSRQLTAAGVPKELAQQVASLDPLFSALDLVEIAEAADIDVIPAAEAYFELAEALDLHWLRERIRDLPRRNYWERQARTALLIELYTELRTLTTELLRDTAQVRKRSQRVPTWLARNEVAVNHCRGLFADLKTASQHDLSMLSVAMREVRSLGRNSNPSQGA